MTATEIETARDRRGAAPADTHRAPRERIALIDNIKGILIILVVIGHVAHPVHNTNPALSCIFDIIYLFHMPLFVFLSGLLAKGAWRDGRLNVDRICSFALLGAAYQLALMIINHARMTLERFCRFTSAPWYLVAMAVWYALTPLLARLGWKAGMACALALSFAGGLVDLSDGFLAVSRTLAFLPWFAAGYYFPVHGIRELKGRRGLWAAVGIALAIALARIVDEHAYDWFFQQVYGDNPFRAIPLDAAGRLVAIAIAVVFSLAAIKLAPSTRSWLTVLGERTLGIYVVHRLIRSWLTFRTGFYDAPVLLDPVAGTLIILALSAAVCAVCALPVFTALLDRVVRHRWFRRGERPPSASQR